MTYNPEGEPRREPLGPPIIPPAPAYPQHVVQPLPPKKSRVGLIVLAAVAVIVLLAGGIAVGTGIANRSNKPAASPTCDVVGVNGCTHKEGNGGGPVVLPTTAAAQVSKVKPDPAGFIIGIKTIKKECFGSAGCNVTFRIDPSYKGGPFTNSVTWEVVYEVKGGQDPLTNHFTLNGSQASFDEEEFIQTKSSSAVLTADVVEVNEL